MSLSKKPLAFDAMTLGEFVEMVTEQTGFCVFDAWMQDGNVFVVFDTEVDGETVVVEEAPE